MGDISIITCIPWEIVKLHEKNATMLQRSLNQ